MAMRTVPTGEEGWTLLKAVRCKLFEFGQDKNWHESGVGFLRLLREDEDATRYRLGPSGPHPAISYPSAAD